MGRYIPKETKTDNSSVNISLEGLSDRRIECLLGDDAITHSIEELFNLLEVVDSLEESQFNSGSMALVNATLENISLSLPEELRISNENAMHPVIKKMLKKMLIDYILNKIKENDQLIYHYNRTFVGWLENKAGRTKKIYKRIDELKSRNFENKGHIKAPFASKLIVNGSMPEPSKIVTVLNYEREIAQQFINDNESQALYKFTDGMVDALLTDLRKKDVGKPSKLWGVLGTMIDWFTPYGYLLNVYRVAVGEVKAKKAVEDMKKGTHSDDIPDLFKLYSSIAKKDTQAPDSGYIRKESLPIFGNSVLTVTKNVPNQRIDVGAMAGKIKSHSAYTGEYGVALKSGRKVKVSEVSSLSKSDADKILSLCDDLIGIAETFLKDGKARSERLLSAYQTVEKKLDAVMRTGSIFYRNSAGFKALTAGMLNVVRYQWNSVYKSQRSYINHIYQTVDALLDYVEKSSN